MEPDIWGCSHHAVPAPPRPQRSLSAPQSPTPSWTLRLGCVRLPCPRARHPIQPLHSSWDPLRYGNRAPGRSRQLLHSDSREPPALRTEPNPPHIPIPAAREPSRAAPDSRRARRSSCSPASSRFRVALKSRKGSWSPVSRSWQGKWVSWVKFKGWGEGDQEQGTLSASQQRE